MFEVEIESILRDLEDLDPTCFERGRKKLRRLPADAAATLVTYLSKPGIDLRAKAAILEFEPLANEKEVPTLAADLLEHSRDPYFTATCITYLGNAGNRALVPLLVDFLTHEDDRVVANTVEALGQLGDDSVCEAIVPFLRGRTERIKANAIIALHKLGYPDIREHIKNLKASEMTRSIQYALGTIGLEIISESLEIATDDGSKKSDLLIALGLHLSNHL